MHAQPHYFKSALLEVVDVSLKLLIVHLGELLYLFLEIERWFTQGRKGSHVKGVIVLDSGSAQLTVPALLANPLLEILPPMGARGVNPFRKLKRTWVVREHGETAELVAVCIEKSVIIDSRFFALDPLAIRQQISLRRLSFDQVAQLILAFVGMGEIELVEKE